jgi:phosphopantothenoylcysteine decarboxylase/phosphopantothenate--cysteine ligase
MKILLGISGGISAYKACDLITGLKIHGHDVHVIMTEHAKEFLTPLTLATLSTHPVLDNMWAEQNGKVEHIDTALWTELFVVYPATVNIIAKFAHGIADDLLSTVYLALPARVKKIVFPAANENMINNPIVLDNMGTLRKYNTIVAPTRVGNLACGYKGDGCVLKPRDAVTFILNEEGI